ncbi:MAG: glycosyltransferase [Anaerolineae bacterium]|uniref:glycosyltransferase n=1 Tax=Candidatus Amarolinea dominans TaxID=3140696 RepID=UPI0031363907|nr:glycosyltransferase [Anaerolineae bacterium]
MTTRPAAADVQAPAAADALRPAVTVTRWDWRVWPAVVAAIRQIQPAVVLIQYQTAAFGLHPAVNLLPGWLRLRLGRRRPRLITTFHDLKFPYLFPKAGPLRLAAVRLLAQRSDAAIATNVEDWQALQRWGLPPFADRAAGRSPGRPVAMIPIGSNIACAPPTGFERDAWRGAWGLGHNDWLLCYFGFLNASKGGDALIACLARLVQEGRPAHLVMIGGQVGSSDPTNQSYLEHVRRRIAELGLQGRVHWTGFVSEDQVSAHLLAADVCVLPLPGRRRAQPRQSDGRPGARPAHRDHPAGRAPARLQRWRQRVLHARGQRGSPGRRRDRHHDQPRAARPVGKRRAVHLAGDSGQHLRAPFTWPAIARLAPSGFIADDVAAVTTERRPLACLVGAPKRDSSPTTSSRRRRDRRKPLACLVAHKRILADGVSPEA